MKWITPQNVLFLGTAVEVMDSITDKGEGGVLYKPDSFLGKFNESLPGRLNIGLALIAIGTIWLAMRAR